MTPQQGRSHLDWSVVTMIKQVLLTLNAQYASHSLALLPKQFQIVLSH